MKCIYCGKNCLNHKKDICITCLNKLTAVNKFIQECNKFKAIIGYNKIKQMEEVQNDDR